MDFWQALLLGGLYWLANIEMMYTFYWQMMDPLFLSVFVGLLFGNVPQAMIVGAYIQPMYLAFLGAGGTAAVDKAAAKGLLHKNNAANKKSSMTIKLNKLA